MGLKKRKFLSDEICAALIIGIATVLAAVIGAYISAYQSRDSAVQTAEAKSTQTAAMAASTATRTLPQPLPSKTPTPSSTPTFPPPTSTKTPTLAPSPTPTPTCPYQGKDDAETLNRLIQAEAEAVNKKNLDIITAIFAPDAFIQEGDDANRVWKSPMARYRDDLFKYVEFKEVEHFGIVLVGPGITQTIAWLTSGSRGYYRVGSGEWTRMDNPPRANPPPPYGSEQWIFGRNRVGCWVITFFRFNAGHVLFP